jgi:inner membrane protein YidH
MSDHPDPAGLPAHFSWLQVRMAADRTLLAWIRTGASLIAFGFGLVQFSTFLDTSPGYKAARVPGGLRLLGVSLLISGTVALMAASLEHVVFRRYLDRMAGPLERPPGSHAAFALALLLGLVGIAAAWAILTRQIS